MQAEFEQSLQAITNNDPTLTALNLEANEIGDASLKALSEAVKNNSTLITLNLEANEIGDASLKPLSDALKKNSTLKSLSLEDNGIGDASLKDLSEGLKNNPTLTSLNLRDNEIGDVGVKYLSEALKTNPGLTFFNLHENKIGALGAKDLSTAVKTNITLRSLDMHDNEIGDLGAKYFGEALKTNATLRSLDLGDNEIGDLGATDFSEGLKNNPTLTSLSLAENAIGEEGVKALSKALKANSTLTLLELWDNSIGDAGARYLSEAVRDNTTLTAIDLDFTGIGEAGVKAFSDILETNFTLLKINGIEIDFKDKIMERNKAIASCIEPFMVSSANQSCELDGKDLKKRLDILHNILRSLNKESPYLVEGCRLLTALRHMTKRGSEIHAFNALIPEFIHNKYQKAADSFLAQLLCGNIGAEFGRENPELQRARCLLILQGFKEQLQRPELLSFAYTALFELLNPGKTLSFGDFKNLQSKTALLNQKTLLALMRRSLNVLIGCEPDKETNQHEIELLETLLQQPDAHPLVGSLLMNSPVFVSELKKAYPAANSFTLPEYSLFCFENPTADFLIPIPDNVPSIKEEQGELFAIKLSCFKNTATDVKKLKQILCAAINKHKPDAVEEMVEEDNGLNCK